MKYLVAAMALVVFLGVIPYFANSEQVKPNVLFIAVDDMNDWIGIMADTRRAITPNLDKLAARGVAFTNGHTAGVYCAPSRTAVFTGQFASTTGFYTTQVYPALRPDLTPLQSTFKAAGYNTYGAGKLFHHARGFIDLRDWTEFYVRTEHQQRAGWPLNSWDEEMPSPPGSILTPEDGFLYQKWDRIKWGVLKNEQEAEMADTIRTDWAISKIRENHIKPFFLGLGLHAPHRPNYSPQKYFDLYDESNIPLPNYKHNDIDDLPEPIKTESRKRSKTHSNLVELGVVDDAVHAYLASISYADAQIGRVLDALEASPYANNTIVVFWSDHGFLLGEKGRWGKSHLWERVSNVPYIWSGPGIAKGKKTDVTVSLIDIYPTLVEMCGLPRPAHTLEGTSLAAALMNPGLATDRDVFLPHREPNAYAVINRNWRYIHYSNGTEELYATQKDPNEWHNLEGDPKLKKVKEKLQGKAPRIFAEPGKLLKASEDLIIEDKTFSWKVME